MSKLIDTAVAANIADAARSLAENHGASSQIDMLVAMTPPTLVKGSIKKGMANAADAERGSSKDLWFVKPENIRVVANLNPRVETPSYLAHVRQLANSMKTNGYYQDKPMAGYVAKDEDTGEDILLVYEGGSRLKAVLLAKSEGAEIDMVPVSVSQEGKNMEDLLVAMHMGNTGRKLSFFEIAIIVKRLTGFNKTPAQISERLCLEKGTVDNMLKLMEIDPKIQHLVATDAMAATLALEVVAEHGSKAYDVLTHAHKSAKKQGKTRITSRFVPGNAFKKAAEKEAEPMFEALAKVKSDSAFGSLAAETQELLNDLLNRLAAAKNPPEQADIAGMDAE